MTEFNVFDLLKDQSVQTIVFALTIVSALVTVFANGVLPTYRFVTHVVLSVYHFVRPHSDSGVYRAEMYDGRGFVLRISDAVELVRKGKKIWIKPIYRKNSSLNFSFLVKQGLQNIYEGSWENLEKPYRGYALLHPKGNGFEGLLIGNTRKFQANFLRIWLERVDGTGIRDLRTPFWKRLMKLLRRSTTYLDKSRAERILKRHQNEAETNQFHWNDLSLNIQYGCCNPKHSTFSTYLLDYALLHTKTGGNQTMLDVGCGSGFYAIAFAKRGFKRTVGLDFPDILPITRSNAEANKVANIVETRKSIGNDIFTNLDPVTDKFDVILANLPIEKERHARHLSSSPYYRSFVAEDGLFESFVTYVKLFLKPNGKAFFCHYGPNENQRLSHLINASGLDCMAEPFESKFSSDRYYVYTLINNEPDHILRWRRPHTKRRR